jgi:hypothetical protein
MPKSVHREFRVRLGRRFAALASSMLISARQAALVLQRAGVNRDRSRRLLEAGFAGPAMRTTGAMLFEGDRVEALAAWPHVDHDEIIELCPEGLYVARVAPDVPLDAGGAWEARVDSLSTVPTDLSAVTRAFIRSRIQDRGFLPWVATLCGFVAVGGELRGLLADHQEGNRFDLGRPSAWFGALRRHRFETGPGRPWSIWGWQPYARTAPAAAKHVIHRTIAQRSRPALQE